MREIPTHLYPFASHWLDLEGLRYHYLDEGGGEPVVAVHGNPTWSFYYRDLVRELRDGYRVVVPDHIGCGMSDKPGDDAYEGRCPKCARRVRAKVGPDGINCRFFTAG